MKKIFTFLITLSMALTLTACNKSEQTNPDEIHLTFWGHQNIPWNESYERVADEFEKENPGIKIDFEFFPYDQFESKVQTSLISKEGGADIYEMWGGWAIEFAPTKALAPVPTELADEIMNDSYQSTYGALLHDDVLYGLPLEFNIEYGGMIVNNHILSENGVGEIKTWDELVAAAEKMTVRDGDSFTVKGFDFINWDSVPYIFLSMILSQGQEYMTEDGKFNFNTEEAVKAWSELVSLVKDKKVTDLSGLTGGEELEGYQQLYANRVAMVPRGPWAISEGTVSFGLEYGTDFSYVGMPFYGEEKAFANETGWSLCVNNSITDEEKEAAFKFVEFFMQDEVIMEHNIACTQIPAKKSVAHDPKLIESMPYAEPLVEILEYGRFIGEFNTDQFKEKINTIFQQTVNGDFASVNDALAKLTDECNSILK